MNKPYLWMLSKSPIHLNLGLLLAEGFTLKFICLIRSQLRLTTIGFMNTMSELKGNCALVIGHPGHELGIWGWMNKVHPIVAVLTDGSGREQNPFRLQLSLDLFKQYN